MHEGKRGNQIRQDYLCCDSFVEYLLLFGDFVHSAASSPLPGSPCSALPHSNPCVCAGHNKSVWRFCWFTVCLCWSGPEEGLCWRQFPTTHQLCCVVLWDTREECSYTQDQSQNSGAIVFPDSGDPHLLSTQPVKRRKGSCWCQDLLPQNWHQQNHSQISL